MPAVAGRGAARAELERLAAIVTAADPPTDDASRAAVTNAFMAAVRALRRLLKSEKPSLVFRSAEVLARVWMTRYRARKSAAALKAPLHAQPQRVHPQVGVPAARA